MSDLMQTSSMYVLKKLESYSVPYLRQKKIYVSPIVATTDVIYIILSIYF
jgi:hypothetical protein